MPLVVGRPLELAQDADGSKPDALVGGRRALIVEAGRDRDAVVADVVKQVAEHPGQDLLTKALALGLLAEKDVELGAAIVSVLSLGVLDEPNSLAPELNGEGVVVVALDEGFANPLRVVVKPPSGYTRLAENCREGGHISGQNRPNGEAFSIDLSSDHGC